MAAGAAAEAGETSPHEVFLSTGTEGPAPQREAAAPLKQAVAERLAAHRHRRASERATEEQREARAATEAQARAEAARSATRRGAAVVRETVAARYKESQSYREFLAAEAERALEQAQAEAEIAARNAQAVAEAQQKLLAELEQWNRPGAAELQQEAAARGELAHALADIALGARELAQESGLSIMEGGLTVRLPEEIKALPLREAAAPRISFGDDSAEELHELEQEIAFRGTAEPALPVIETQAIPGNIIEFPRQLVASRKARPRRAEGPLLEEAPPEPQLRIFEVEAEQIATAPEPAAEAAGAPEWQSLLLDAHVLPQPAVHLDAQMHLTFQPQTAPVHQRLMAAAVDGTCVAAAFVGAATVAVLVSGAALKAMPLPLLAGSATASFGVFAVLYQGLFFSFSGQTPGMRYARIALCTFGDDNPSRKAMRRRIFAALLSACPLGLGFLWALLDDDKLGWHDRITRMYQRAY